MYQILFSEQSSIDISLIKTYIKYQLSNPESAEEICEEIISMSMSFNEFPERFAKVVIGQNAYHRVSIKNFNIYYCVDKQNQIVIIARVLYGGADINGIMMMN